MQTDDKTVRAIIKKLLSGEDYRVEVLAIINREFLKISIDFFKKIIEAKLENKSVTLEWYKSKFLNSDLEKNEIATNAGLNMKTITNSYGTSCKQVVINASNENFDSLVSFIEGMIENENENDFDLNLTIKMETVSVDLSLSESLIVINALAVKRAALRGSQWSAVGKAVEKPLMRVLCELYGVPEKHYVQSTDAKLGGREVDFRMQDTSGKAYACEVKLMGKGNPESADAPMARDSDIFVADTLSKSVKKELDTKDILWVELRNEFGFRKFRDILKKLDIPHQDLSEDDLESKIETALGRAFQ